MATQLIGAMMPFGRAWEDACQWEARMEENTRLMDVGEYPEIYADGIGDVHFLEYTTRIVFFAWHKLDGVYRRGISGAVRQPTAAMSPNQIAALHTAVRRPLWNPENVPQFGTMQTH